MKKLIHIVCWLGGFVGSGQSATAWEADVHYVLTFWLAEQAGFSRQDAFAIAQANQEIDDSAYTSAVGSMIWILTKGDKGAAENVKRLHFPSDAPFPSPAMARAVKANSPIARRDVVNCLKLDTAADALQRLGAALHPFQDSWSHEGVPDVPLRPAIELRPELSSAHPESRGGWGRHDADLTHLHPQQTSEMASETYKLLQQYLAANPKRLQSKPQAWSAIAKDVSDFARAATRAEKNTWAATHLPLEASEASKTATLTLSGAAAPPGRVRYLKPGEKSDDAAPPELEARARDFVAAWLRNGSPGAASEFVDIETVANSFPPAFGGSNRVGAAGIWVRKTLASYLAGDHAMINRAGHAMPDDPGYSELPENLAKDTRFQMRAVPEAGLPTKADLVPVRAANGAKTWVLAVFRDDLPYDALALRWQQRGSTWRIVQLIPVVH